MLTHQGLQSCCPRTSRSCSLLSIRAISLWGDAHHGHCALLYAQRGGHHQGQQLAASILCLWRQGHSWLQHCHSRLQGRAHCSASRDSNSSRPPLKPPGVQSAVDMLQFQLAILALSIQLSTGLNPLSALALQRSALACLITTSRSLGAPPNTSALVYFPSSQCMPVGNSFMHSRLLGPSCTVRVEAVRLPSHTTIKMTN